MRVSNFAVAAIAPLAFATQVAIADSHGKAVEYRQAVMTTYGWNFKPMGAMVNNKAPYDAEKFKHHATDLAAAAHLDLLSGFPEDSEHEESDVKSEIWLNWENFEQKYRNFQEKAAALNAAADSADLDKIRPTFGATAKTCKDCHKAFRE
ncbi:c-type cytochrome [Solemya velesiana gill symbiont]|uniref:Cytochrome C n=1 Tax=Solemya velesiana gill symbiont TaxID=1918948 RepID=A0A1T2KXL4_9GAMM|nr:cytochrome c [Solemya velesiana gill symbiont]OOZ37599.1 hypothetical protein BOW51_01495 [Solemya velesiana gill symbiont]